MITISTEKGLVRVTSWADVTERPGFTAPVDASTGDLHQILSQYELPTKVKCGLASCKTGHMKGYLVVMKDGRETNIGHLCGKKHFGVSFKELTSKFKEDLRRKEQRESLDSLRARAPALLQKISELREREKGADWANRWVRTFTKRSGRVPDTIVDYVRDMRRRNDPRVVLTRLATAEEIELQEVAMQDDESRKKPRGPEYVEEVIATLDGLPCLYPQNDLRRLLIVELAEPLQRVIDTSNDSLKPGDAPKIAKLNADAELRLSRASRVVEEARSFFVPRNLTPLERLLDKNKDAKRKFRSLLKDLR